jgi:hypothetical protein
MERAGGEAFFQAQRAGFFFLKALIFVRICSVIGRKMVEVYLQPDS